MRYVRHPSYVQWVNEWEAVVLFTYALVALVVVLPKLFMR